MITVLVVQLHEFGKLPHLLATRADYDTGGVPSRILDTQGCRGAGPCPAT
jgi:hypothetical protein